MSLKETWKKVADFAGDLTTLDVVTLTGTIKLQGETGRVEVSTLSKAIQDAVEQGMVAGTGGAAVDVNVAAFTHVELDLDSTHFVQSDADPKILESHAQIVRASQETRAGLLTLIKSLA